jgi:hypothetical protein
VFWFLCVGSPIPSLDLGVREIGISYQNDMQNHAHRTESREKRLRRLREGPPVEAIDTLLNSLANFFNNELGITPDHYQSSLLFLGIHASALTISEAPWDATGVKGYKKFLETFVDGTTTDTRFSLIADFIHDWRNVLAHQWVGSIGHQIEYDYDMNLGWAEHDGVIVINPRIYCGLYLKAFAADGIIWKYESMFSEYELEQIKERIIQKYIDQ